MSSSDIFLKAPFKCVVLVMISWLGSVVICEMVELIYLGKNEETFSRVPGYLLLIDWSFWVGYL